LGVADGVGDGVGVLDGLGEGVSVGTAVAVGTGVFVGIGVLDGASRPVGVPASSSTAIACNVGCSFGFSSADWF